MKKILFFLSLIMLCLVYGNQFMDFDFDLWSRLAVGKIFFELGHVISFDPFGFTAKNAMWIDHEWLSSVVFQFFASRFGDLGLISLKFFVLFITLFLVYKTIKLKTPDYKGGIVYFWLLAVGLSTGFASTIRCQVFSFMFFALWIYLLERIRRGEDRLLWILPVTMLVWANMHGGFVTGLCLLVLYGVGEFLNKKPFQKYFLSLFFSLSVTLINPYGIKYWEYIVQAVTMQRPHIQEWRATSLLGPVSEWIIVKFLILISFSSVVAQFVKNKGKNIAQNTDITKYLVIMATLFMALKHVKHQPFFIIASGCFLYEDLKIFFAYLASYFSENIKMYFTKIDLAKESTIACVLLMAFLVQILMHPLRLELPPSKFPFSAVEFIKLNNLNGNLLSTFNWGSYLTYKLYPECLVAIDGRYEEVYTDETDKLTSNFIFILDNNWAEVLKKYKIDMILLDRQFPSYKSMKENKEWKEVFVGPQESVFVSKNKALKSYKMPEFTYKSILDDKYKTSDDFLDTIKKLKLRDGQNGVQ